MWLPPADECGRIIAQRYEAAYGSSFHRLRNLRAALSDEERAAVSDQQCRRVVFFDELGVVGLPVETDHLSLDLWPESVSRCPAPRARDLSRVASHLLLI